MCMDEWSVIDRTRRDVRTGWWRRRALCPDRYYTRKWRDLCPARSRRLPRTLRRLRRRGLPLLWRARRHSSSAAALRPPSSLSALRCSVSTWRNAAPWPLLLPVVSAWGAGPERVGLFSKQHDAEDASFYFLRVLFRFTKLIFCYIILV